MAEKEKPKLSRRARLAREFNAQFVETLTTLLATAFGLVAAFAWNEVVKGAIDKYIATGSTLVSQFIYALLVTLLAVIISFQLGKIAAIYKVNSDEDGE